MKIRSVTIFDGTADARTSESIARSGRAAAGVRKRLIDAGFDVQTTRLALAPAYTWMPALDVAKSIEAAQAIEKLANEAGIDYVSLGPVADEIEDVKEIEKLPELIAQTRAVFFNAPIISMCLEKTWALVPIARAIKGIAALTENGFGNLRFAAIAECDSGIPFFPAAYAELGDFSCALAMECADLALSALNSNGSVSHAMRALSQSIEQMTARIDTALTGIDLPFRGCDWSLAPHPDMACSIGAAIEKMTGVPFGEWGTLSAVFALTKAIRSARVEHVGFSGVFLPLLEDAVLANRTRDISDLQKLLLYCSVCGSGLDTVPLAGDVSENAIAALLGDVATLAQALSKPLTARLMPIPGLKAGESTRFDFPYLVNGHTLPLAWSGSAMRQESMTAWLSGLFRRS